MENEFKTIGHRVKVLRMNSGVRQTELADKIGMSQTNLSNIESGRTATTIQVLLKIRQELGCRMADFFVDIDGVEEQVPKANDEGASKSSIELEDAVQILKLLKAVNIKGV